nr:hypothetical protein [Tanacetum cinerariifolium]
MANRDPTWNMDTGKGLLGPIGRSCGGKGGSCSGNGRRCGSIAERGGGGVEKMSSTGSKFIVRGKDYLEGCIGAGGEEVNGGGDDFGVSKSFLGKIPSVVIGESGGETFRDDG